MRVGSKMGRPQLGETKLAEAIRRDGRPAYQIGALANITQTTMSHLCHGREKLRPIQVRRLCAVLEVDPDQIVE